MAVTHSTGANGGKVAIGTAIKDELAGGSVRLCTASLAVKATLALGTGANVPTVNSTSGVIDFCPGAFTLSDATASSGTVTVGQFRDSGGTQVIMSCTVGIGTSFDINMTNNVLGTGDTVKITALTYTPPT